MRERDVARNSEASGRCSCLSALPAGGDKKTKNKTKRGATNASDSEHSLDVSVLLGNSVSSSRLKNPSLVHWFIVLHEKKTKTDC